MRFFKGIVKAEFETKKEEIREQGQKEGREEVLQEFANMSADELLAYFGKDGSDDDSLSDDDFQGYGRR